MSGVEKIKARRKSYPEDALQIATANILRIYAATNVLFTHVANENRGSVRAGARARAMGQRAGWADWTIIWGPPVKILVIELKIGKNKTSTTQREFLALALRVGCMAQEARSLEEFIAILKFYDVPSRNGWPR